MAPLNRRALLSAFLAAPVGVRLGVWCKRKPIGPIRDLTYITVGPGMMFTRLQDALDRAAEGATVYLAAGYCETFGAYRG